MSLFSSLVLGTAQQIPLVLTWRGGVVAPPPFTCIKKKSATPTKLTSSVTAYDYSGKNKVPELQKFFQKADGFHLKRGLPDQMLYRTTMALTLGGTIYCLIALYMASQPRNK